MLGALPLSDLSSHPRVSSQPTPVSVQPLSPRVVFFILKGLKTIKREHFMT